MGWLKTAISSRVVAISTRICAWALLGLIAFWTLGPLADRPKLGPPELERFAAYCLTGFLFSGGYGRPRLTAGTLCVVAVLLELGQLFVPGRDAGIPDAIEKMLGAVAGVAIAVLVRGWASQPPDKSVPA
jgi:uncharacterized membrane protein YccC